MNPISIVGISSLSALGTGLSNVFDSYQTPSHKFSIIDNKSEPTWVAQISSKDKKNISAIKNENSNYKKLDDTVLYALFCARGLMKITNWKDVSGCGINIGSSRGATTLFEHYHQSFISGDKLSPHASPTTTLGNIASWVAHDLECDGIAFSHSIACSTGLHALLNGMAWLKAGLSTRFIIGASEAPLTAFTLAQMHALKLYTPYQDVTYPCRAMDMNKSKNTMVLGEATSMLALSKQPSDRSLAHIVGIGYATEQLQHGSSISKEAICIQKAMRMAIAEHSDIDVVVLHSPGTIQGDNSEYKAIQAVFGTQIPALTTNKWKVGHTFATSGLLSIEMAIIMLREQLFLPIPYLDYHNTPKRINKILVNAVGFGGNAVSVVLTL